MRRGRAGPGDAAAGAGSRRREPRAGPRAQPPGAGSRRGRRLRCGGGAGGRKTASGAGYSRQRAGDEPGLGDAAAGAVSRRPGPAGRRRRELRGVVVGRGLRGVVGRAAAASGAGAGRRRGCGGGGGGAARRGRRRQCVCERVCVRLVCCVCVSACAGAATKCRRLCRVPRSGTRQRESSPSARSGHSAY